MRLWACLLPKAAQVLTTKALARMIAEHFSCRFGSQGVFDYGKNYAQRKALLSAEAIVLLALALSMDAFAVAFAAGCVLRRPRLNHYLRLAVTFGGMQWLMPLLGALLGATLRHYVEALAHWIAFLLLVAIGLHMIWEGIKGLRGEAEQASAIDPTKGLSLLLLGLATSLDALTVGFSFALVGEDVTWAAVVIGLTCALITALGCYLGQSLSRLPKVNGYAEIVGGLVLAGLGLHVL